MSSFSSTSQQHIVSLSFHEATFSTKRREYIKKKSDSLLDLEVIGELHNFEDIADALFAHYLSAVRGGDILHEHVWRFEPVGLEEADGETLALDSNKPILSSDMRAREPYELGMCDPIACKINVGFEMIFFYDEGSSTRVAVTVDAVEPLDANLSETSSFPRVKGTDVGTSTDVIEQPTDNVLDALFPSLQKTVFDPAYGKCFFGSCRDDLHGAIEAGLCQNGDQVYCPLRFGKFEDFLILMNKATEILQKGSSSIRPGWTDVIIFPPETQTPAEEEMIALTLACFARVARFMEMSRGQLGFPYPKDDAPTEEEQYMMCGPKMIGLRLSQADSDKERAELRAQGVDLAAMFPAMMTTFSDVNDKYLHFTLNHGSLTIASKMKKGT